MAVLFNGRRAGAERAKQQVTILLVLIKTLLLPEALYSRSSVCVCVVVVKAAPSSVCH